MLVPWETKDKGSGKDSGLSLKEGRLGERGGISTWFCVEKENLKDSGCEEDFGDLPHHEVLGCIWNMNGRISYLLPCDKSLQDEVALNKDVYYLHFRGL